MQSVLLFQVTFDIKFYFFLRTNIVLGTIGKVHFAGTYQEVSSSAQAAAGDWQKHLILLPNMKRRKERKKPYQKPHHEKLFFHLILLNNVASSYELVLSNKAFWVYGMRWKAIEPV